jgi:hypothetical protein
MCLLFEPTIPDQPVATTFFVDPDLQEHGDGSSAKPWLEADWSAIDAALAIGNVQVMFSALEEDGQAEETWNNPLEIKRTDQGPYRVIFDGISHYNSSDSHPVWSLNPSRRHAIVRGVTTGFDNIARHRVTIRGFEITGSEDKGVYWRAGDDIVLEDLIVHDNMGSPAINLEYANRSGLPSSSFIIRNSHVFNQNSECIYIGGSEGEDRDAHHYVEVSNNLIHHCWKPMNDKHDGINIKDRILDVVVSRNVIFTVDWGIQGESSGNYSGNLVFDTERNGFQLGDIWGTGLSNLILRDNTILRAGEHGIRLGADDIAAKNIVMERTTLINNQEAGVLFAGNAGIEARIAGLALVGNQVGMDGWGDVTVALSDCLVSDNETNDARAVAGTTSVCQQQPTSWGDLENPAGPDGIFFTADDPWIIPTKIVVSLDDMNFGNKDGIIHQTGWEFAE